MSLTKVQLLIKMSLECLLEKPDNDVVDWIEVGGLFQSRGATKKKHLLAPYFRLCERILFSTVMLLVVRIPAETIFIFNSRE